MIEAIKILYYIRDWAIQKIEEYQSECPHKNKIQTYYNFEDHYDSTAEYFTFTCEDCDKQFYDTRYR